MKAVICEFCEKVIPDSERDDDYKAVTVKEKKLLFNSEHVCMDCTIKVKAAVEGIRKGRKTK